MSNALAVCIGAALTPGLAACFGWRRERQRLHVSARRESDMAARIEALERALRLTASELRGPALTLLGATQAGSGGAQASLISLARQLLDLAEALLEETDRPEQIRRLHEADIRVAPVLEFAVSQVASGLAPGRRVWRIQPELNSLILRADRRALHQILLRILSSAALASRDGDWVDIRVEEDEDSWALIIEDEGNGLSSADNRPGQIGTRGLGVGLSLARSLMAAHGGSLQLHSTAQVGTRAVLRFPHARLRVAKANEPHAIRRNP